MTNARFEMKKVGLDYFQNSPFLFRSTVNIRCTPAQLFAGFEDADSWLGRTSNGKTGRNSANPAW